MQEIIKQVEDMESLSAVDNSFDLASEAEKKVRLTYRGI
jgi:hypothetical protein